MSFYDRKAPVLLAAALAAIVAIFLTIPPGGHTERAYADGEAPNDRNERWLRAIEFLEDELADRHIDPFFKITEEDFRDRLRTIKSDVPRLEDYEIVVALMAVVASIGDSHTHLNADQTGIFHRLPIKMEWFTDGLYITRAPDAQLEILGKRVLGIDGLPIRAVEDRIRPTISHDNDAQIKVRGPGFMIVPEVLAAVGVAGSTDSITLNLEGARDVVMRPMEILASPPSTRLIDSLACDLPLYLENPDSIYWYRLIEGAGEDAGTVYLRYRSCRDMDGRPFSDLTREVLTLIDSTRPKRLIFDVRSNSGGSSAVARPLIAGLSTREHINHKGGIFVLIDRGTYSSALLNALDFQNDTDAVLIGEPTGGKPNHYGEIRFFTLPNTTIVVTYSRKHFSTSMFDTPSLNPDIEAGLSFEDFLGCRDPALEAALGYGGEESD